MAVTLVHPSALMFSMCSRPMLLQPITPYRILWTIACILEKERVGRSKARHSRMAGWGPVPADRLRFLFAPRYVQDRGDLAIITPFAPP